MKALLLALLLFPSYTFAQVLGTIPVMIDAAPENFGPVIVPLKATVAEVIFDSKDQLSGEQTLTVVLERSMNGGATYEPAGGQVFTATNQPANFVVALPGPNTQGRTLRGRMTLYSGRWRGKAFIELE